MNELHHAGCDGSVERTIAALSRGVIDIDQGEDQMGYTPLMFAAFYGHNQVVRVLLNKGASMSVVDGGGFTALHVAAMQGHLAVTKLLVKAGADLKAKSTAAGSTPLLMAAEEGHSEVIGVLIEAGANPNSRTVNGTTPLFMAAVGGHVDAIKVLLRAKADPLLTASGTSGDDTLLPLDVAASGGHLEMAHELIREHGIEGCGGASNGVDALQAAAEAQHVEVMSMLTGAGVVDTGAALRGASASGRESSVKFLLQQWKRNSSGGEGADYLEACDPYGRTPIMLCSIWACRPCSPRITRLLVDTGADTTAAVRLTDKSGVVFFEDTPLAFTNLNIREMIKGEDATEEQLHSLEATRRLLMRVEAVHAVSWLWVCDGATSVTQTTAKGRKKTKATPTPLTSMVPILRRRVQRPRVLLAALFRHSGKPY